MSQFRRIFCTLMTSCVKTHLALFISAIKSDCIPSFNQIRTSRCGPSSNLNLARRESSLWAVLLYSSVSQPSSHKWRIPQRLWTERISGNNFEARPCHLGNYSLSSSPSYARLPFHSVGRQPHHLISVNHVKKFILWQVLCCFFADVKSQVTFPHIAFLTESIIFIWDTTIFRT